VCEIKKQEGKIEKEKETKLCEWKSETKNKLCVCERLCVGGRKLERVRERERECV